MVDRTTLALPIDVARMMDHTTSQTQLTNNAFQGTPDDRDLLNSYIEDAEDEFRALTGGSVGLRRVGTSGRRDTYEQVTYEVSGHEAYKRNWSRVAGNYLPQEVTKDLKQDRVLPFDSAAGDEAYFYRGIGDTSSNNWDDVTGEVGDTWDIVDPRDGTLVFHPIELMKAMVPGSHGIALSSGRLDKLRFAITYRYGAPGGGRDLVGATTLAEDITASQTGLVNVDDAALLVDAGELTGSVILKVGSEYLRATVDVSNDQINILERGVRGTSAVDPDNGDRVQYVPPSVRKAVAARSGMDLLRSGRYSAFMPDSEDAIDKNDMMDNLQTTWDRIMEALS